MSDDHPIYRKIDEGTVTTDDFNSLIQEATPEAVRRSLAGDDLVPDAQEDVT